MRGSVQGFGAGASPPMQPTKEHFALQHCEIGELRRHVGRGVDRVFRLFSFFFLYGCYVIIRWISFKSIYVTASKRSLNAYN